MKGLLYQQSVNVIIFNFIAHHMLAHFNYITVIHFSYIVHYPCIMCAWCIWSHSLFLYSALLLYYMCVCVCVCMVWIFCHSFIRFSVFLVLFYNFKRCSFPYSFSFRLFNFVDLFSLSLSEFFFLVLVWFRWSTYSISVISFWLVIWLF